MQSGGAIIETTHGQVDAQLESKLAPAAVTLVERYTRLGVRRTQLRKGKLARYLRAVPAVAVLTTAWTSGEVWGYVTKRA